MNSINLKFILTVLNPFNFIIIVNFFKNKNVYYFISFKLLTIFIYSKTSVIIISTIGIIIISRLLKNKACAISYFLTRGEHSVHLEILKGELRQLRRVVSDW